MRPTIFSLLLLAPVLAQQTVAPTPELAGLPRGENVSGYNIVDSFEAGYRFATIGGDNSTYRSSVNFGNGIRLLGSYLSVNSKSGRGRIFDSLVITTQGLGNDPYESALARIRKNRLYSYEMAWRRNDYVNPGLVTGGAEGAHLLDTRYQMQDHDITIFPESRIRIYAGFTATSQTGAAVSSAQSLDFDLGAEPFFTNVHRLRREYRIGSEIRFGGFRLNFMRGWDNFKEDTPPVPDAGVRRIEPYHGNSPYWRVGLFREAKILSLNGRFTYTSGERNFVVDETVSGTGALQLTRQVVSIGDARRPVTTGNVNLILSPGSKLTIVNSSSLYDVRTSGNAAFTEFDNGTNSFDTIYYQYLGIRTFANETDVNYQFSPWVGAFAGYDYSERVIHLTRQTSTEQVNHLNDARTGVRLRPLKPLSILVSAELGRASDPFTPTAGRHYHVLNTRVQYRSKPLLLSAGAQSDYRFNSVTVSSYSTQSRRYFVDGSWTLRPGLALNASFSRAHVYSIGGIAYFQSFRLIEGDQSIYLSNLNTITAGVQYTANRRAEFCFAYVRTQDLGGDTRGGSSNPLFVAAQTFPMRFDSPLARVSIRLGEKLRWNAGYQYYGYGARYYAARNFRANTGYTSLSWSF